jgi:flagellar motor switch protein FliN
MKAGIAMAPLPDAESMAFLAEVPMEVEAELDRKTMTMREVLALETGSVIKLNRSAGENIDIVVGGALVAFGEIVVFEEIMGVRITDFNADK